MDFESWFNGQPVDSGGYDFELWFNGNPVANENTLIDVEVTFDIQWSVLAAVTQTSDISWSILGGVSATSDVQWSALAPVQASASSFWSVLGGVAASHSAFWNVLAGVTATYSCSWSILGGVETANLCQWSVLGGVTATQLVQWSILGAVQATDDSTWSILYPVDASASMSWSILQGVTTTDSVSWSVLEGVTAFSGVTWDLAAESLLHEESAMKAWHKFLVKYFDGASHVVSEQTFAFPLANLAFQQSAMAQGLQIRVVLIHRGNTLKTNWMGRSAARYEVTWSFMITGDTEASARKASDLLYAICLKQRGELVKLGLMHVEPQPATPLSNTEKKCRMMMVSGMRYFLRDVE